MNARYPRMAFRGLGACFRRMVTTSTSFTAAPITTFEELIDALESLLLRIDTRVLAPIYRSVVWQAHQELLRNHPSIQTRALPDRAILRVAHELHTADIERIEGTRLIVKIAGWFKQGEIVHARVIAASDDAEHTCRIVECRRISADIEDAAANPHRLTLEKL